MKTKIIILGIILCSLAITGFEQQKKHPCPTCADRLTWNAYGSWTLIDEGWDGMSGGKETTTDLIKDCRWHLDPENPGGTGNSYKAYSCDGAVVFTWEYGSFIAIDLYEGWRGATSEGIRIGDDREKFLTTYPQFKQPDYVSSDSSCLSDRIRGRAVDAFFSKDDKLARLYVRY